MISLLIITEIIYLFELTIPIKINVAYYFIKKLHFDLLLIKLNLSQKSKVMCKKKNYTKKY